jgi:plastocyanin
MHGVIKRVAAVTLAGAVLLGAIGTAAAATSTVRAKGDRWRPVHTYIGRGDRVIWKNPTSRVHDLKAYGGGWSLSTQLSPGESVSHKFRQLGTYKFRCVRHSAIVSGTCQGMCGLVHVVA